jgi:uncharacterized membrane protein
MRILHYLLVFALAFIVMSLVDALWHMVIFGRVYSKGLLPLARTEDGKMKINLLFTFLSQFLFVASLVFLVLFTVPGGELPNAALVGAFAGTLAISVYGVTNYALFKDCGLNLTLLELIWGPVLGAIGGLFTSFINLRF